MSLKIIGGEYGGPAPCDGFGPGPRARPRHGPAAPRDNPPGHRVGAIVWDLFAGTGASGMESLSRGAQRVLFVEKNNKALDVLRQNLATLGDDAVARSVVLRADAWDPPVMHRAAFGAARDDTPDDAASDVEVAPDVVFLDPPYMLVAEDPVKSMARARRLLDRTAPGGCVVFHFEAGVLDEDDFDTDLDLDLREWGSTAIAMLWRKGEAPERLQRRWAKERAASDD